MNIQLLGTSSGTPTNTRNVSATAVWAGQAKRWYLVDCGEGTQYQLLKCSLSSANLKAVFITHVHGDHCFGLPGLISSMQLQGRTEPLQVFGPAGVREIVETALTYSQAYMAFDIHYHLVDGSKTVYCDDSFAVQSCTLSHRVPSYAYCFEEVNLQARLRVDRLEQDGIPKGPLWGRIQRGEVITLENGARIEPAQYLDNSRTPRIGVIAGDNDRPECLDQFTRPIDVLVHEATFTEAVLQHVGPKSQHSSSHRVAHYAQERGIPNLVLTHFSARFGDSEGSAQSIALVEAEARAAYQGRLYLARDFDHYYLDSVHCLQKLNTH